MALLKNCEIYYLKADPKRPNAAFNKENPTWEVQIRTSNPEQKAEWESLGLKPKLIVGKEGEPNEGEAVLTADGKRQWRVNLKKKSITKKKEPAEPVKVVDGNLDPIDPNTVGHGSIAHVRIYQYDFTDSKGKPAQVAVLMGIQLKRHLVHAAKDYDDAFEADDEYERVEPEEQEGDDGGAGAKEPAKAAPTPAPSVTKLADERSDAAF
jgi:hypothetical protein